MRGLTEYLNENKSPEDTFNGFPMFDKGYDNMVNQIQKDSKKNFTTLIKDKLDSDYTVRNLYANKYEEIVRFNAYDRKTGEVFYVKVDWRGGDKERIIVDIDSNKEFDPKRDIFNQVRGKRETLPFNRDSLSKYRKYYTKSGSHFTWGMAYLGYALDTLKKKTNLKIK